MTQQVSVLIPTYNRSEYLKIAALSVIKQSYKYVELVIFDNCSSDDTQNFSEKLAEENNNVTYIRHRENLGSDRNYEIAFEYVNTPYFLILADDDFLLPDFLEKAIRILEEETKYKFVIFDCLYLDENYKLCSTMKTTGKKYSFVNPPKIFPKGVPFNWGGIVFRKELAPLYRQRKANYEKGVDVRFLSVVMARFAYIYYSDVGSCIVNSAVSSSAQRGEVSEGLKYHVIQMQRLVEIIYDDLVDNRERQWAYIQLRKDYRTNLFLRWCFYMLILIQRAWEKPKREDFASQVYRELDSLRLEGFNNMANTYQFIFHNKQLKLFYIKIILPVLKIRRSKRIRTINRLARDYYSGQMEEVKKIIDYSINL